MWEFLKRRVPKKVLYPLLAVFIVGIGILIWWIYGSAKDQIANVTNEEITCPMNGVKTTKEKADRRPFAVMVENSVAARPQAGLDQADLVYETIAEGGITRTMAVYACSGDTTSAIGPVRSARPYFVDWVEGISAFYVHAGGSPEALDQIKADKVFDIGNFSDARYFWRSSNRVAPHNLYTKYSNLLNLVKAQGYKLDGKYEELAFKDDAQLADRASAQTVTVNFSSFTYQTKWVYDQQTNLYLRYLAGAPHKDQISGKQLKAKTIIVERVKVTPGGAADHNRVYMGTIGSGAAIVFQDGKAIKGTWEKKFRADRTRYYDESGNEIPLNAGQIWIEVVKPDAVIDY